MTLGHDYAVKAAYAAGERKIKSAGLLPRLFDFD
jgi:hypothetical protein